MNVSIYDLKDVCMITPLDLRLHIYHERDVECFIISLYKECSFNGDV